jgi:hypothetical protein
MPQGSRTESIYGATAVRAAEGVSRPGTGADPEALTHLLIHARRALANHSTLSLDYPAGEMADAISAAGFKLRRTLIWMRA